VAGLQELQIPSDEGGMHVKITRPMFEEFMQTCDQLNLVDPSTDLVPTTERQHSRWDLEQRYAEKELFKQVLSGNGNQAKQVIEAMQEYRSKLRMPSRAYSAIHGKSRPSAEPPPSASELSPQAAAEGRVTALPSAGDVMSL